MKQSPSEEFSGVKNKSTGRHNMKEHSSKTVQRPVIIALSILTIFVAVFIGYDIMIKQQASVTNYSSIPAKKIEEERLRKTVSLQREFIQNLKNELNDAKLKLNHVQGHLFKRNIPDLEVKLAHARLELMELASYNDKLSERIDVLEEERLSHAKKVDQLETSIEALTVLAHHERDDKEIAMITYQEEINTIQQTAEEEKGHVRRLNQELAETKNLLSQTNLALQNLHDYNDLLNLYTSLNDGLNEEREGLLITLQEKGHEVDTLEENLQQLTIETEESILKYEDLNQELNELKKQIDTHIVEHSLEKEQLLDQINNQDARLQTAIQQLQDEKGKILVLNEHLEKTFNKMALEEEKANDLEALLHCRTEALFAFENRFHEKQQVIDDLSENLLSLETELQQEKKQTQLLEEANLKNLKITEELSKTLEEKSEELSHHQTALSQRKKNVRELQELLSEISSYAESQKALNHDLTNQITQLHIENQKEKEEIEGLHLELSVQLERLLKEKEFNLSHIQELTFVAEENGKEIAYLQETIHEQQLELDALNRQIASQNETNQRKDDELTTLKWKVGQQQEALLKQQQYVEKLSEVFKQKLNENHLNEIVEK